MKTALIILILGLTFCKISAQVAINADSSAPNPAAMLDIQSNNKGVLIPRLSSTQRLEINPSPNGLLVFDASFNAFFYAQNGQWVEIGTNEIPDTDRPIPILFQGGRIMVHPTDNGVDLNWSDAAKACDLLVAFEKSDWYLPSKLELDAMYKQSYLITGLSQNNTGKYWSSTEVDLDNAYTQRLDYGGPDPDNKKDTTGHLCRCVRPAN